MLGIGIDYPLNRKAIKHNINKDLSALFCYFKNIQSNHVFTLHILAKVLQTFAFAKLSVVNTL